MVFDGDGLHAEKRGIRNTDVIAQLKPRTGLDNELRFARSSDGIRAVITVDGYVMTYNEFAFLTHP
jgi:hypothetical protein